MHESNFAEILFQFLIFGFVIATQIQKDSSYAEIGINVFILGLAWLVPYLASTYPVSLR